MVTERPPPPTPPPAPSGAFWLAATWAVLRRPHLWITAVRQALRLARPGWWRRAPFLPLPDAGYMEFRFVTNYGADGEPTVDDLITYLEWCRAA